jgi:hypothetical protein
VAALASVAMAWRRVSEALVMAVARMVHRRRCYAARSTIDFRFAPELPLPDVPRLWRLR